MRAIKVVVFLLGLLILAGFVVVAVTLARRTMDRADPVPPAGVTDGIARAEIALATGERVRRSHVTGERLVLEVVDPAGSVRMLVVDLESGALTGEIMLVPGERAEPAQ